MSDFDDSHIVRPDLNVQDDKEGSLRPKFLTEFQGQSHIKDNLSVFIILITDGEIVAALIASGTVAEAASKVGLSTRALYDRMLTRDFKALYSGAKTDIVRGAVLCINNKLQEAIETVADIMNDKGTNPAIRLQAAQTIITNAAKFSERLQHEEYQNQENNIKNPFDLSYML